MDLTFNTATHFDTSEPKLLTYEENCYCALVPLPKKTSVFQLIFIKPFDEFIWILMFITIMCCCGIWWLFRLLDSNEPNILLAFGIFTMFIGQGAEFPRQKRWILAILLQLIIFMIFILSNAYEGVVTSFMIQPIQENRLGTVNQLTESNYEIMTDEEFAFKVRNDEKFQAIKQRINTSGNSLNTQYDDEIIRRHYVFI